MKDYLPTILPSWQTEVEPLNEDDAVLVIDHTLPRDSWLKGIIDRTYPNKDGRVRVADVRSVKGIMRRPVNKLVKLMVRDEGEVEDKR